MSEHSSTSLASTVTLECFHCQTRYRVQASRLAGISNVRCSKCQQLTPIEPLRQQIEQASPNHDEVLKLDLPKEQPWGEEDKADFFLKPGPLRKRRFPQEQVQNLKQQHDASKISREEIPEERIHPLSGLEAAVDVQMPSTPPPPPFEEVAAAPVSSLEEEDLLTQEVLSDSTKEAILERSSDRSRFFSGRVAAACLLLTLSMGGGYFLIKSNPNWAQAFGVIHHKFTLHQDREGYKVYNHRNNQALFVVEGFLENHFEPSDRIHEVQLKSIAMDEFGDILATSTTYIGHVLSVQQLKSQSIASIKASHQKPVSETASNYLSPKERIPFQIIFFDSISRIRETSTRVVGYRHKDQTVYVRTFELQRIAAQ